MNFERASGMLHDVGMFEQVKRYNTFIDMLSVDHAEFGADLLFGEERLINCYLDDSSKDEELETVIRQHNKFRIDPLVSGKVEDCKGAGLHLQGVSVSYQK